MGNSPSPHSLTHLQTLTDRHFGVIDLYRSSENVVVMKSTCTHVAGQKGFRQFQRAVKWCQKEGHSLVVPVLSSKTKTESSICINYVRTELCTQYFNFTLQDLLNRKRPLQQSELWQLLYQLLTLVLTLKNNDLGMHLQHNKVFLTLKGQLSVYVHHLVSFEESVCNSSVSMGEEAAKMVIQLATGKQISNSDDEQMEVLIALASICNKCKHLGRMLRQLLHRQKSQANILQEIDLLLADNLIRKANQIKLSKYKYIIPDAKREKDTELSQERASFSKNIQNKLVLPNNDSNMKSVDDSTRDIQSQSISQESYRLNTLMSEIDEKKARSKAKMETLRQKKELAASKAARDRENSFKFEIAKSKNMNAKKPAIIFPVESIHIR